MSLEKLQEIERLLANVFSDQHFKDSLSPADYQIYAQHRQDISYQKGELIITEGHKPQGVYFVVQGTIKLYKHGFHKKEQILRLIPKGDIIGYRSMLCGEEFAASAEALCPTQVIYLPNEVFMHLLQVDRQLSFAMLKKTAFELGEASTTIAYLAQKTVRERLAEVLLMLEQKLGTDPEGFIKISLTREELASLIGTSTESLIRLISEFKLDKIIGIEGRCIKIENHQQLINIGHGILGKKP
jgi:CRP/FNR family transcriptional regulator, polysaccharide utilization system transcription regulator